MGLPVALFIKPAMKLVGTFLQKIDKNITGADDKIGRLLVKASSSNDLDADIEKFAAMEGLDLGEEPPAAEPQPA